MAGSRLEKFGTVFTRVRDLIRSGVIRPSDKPIWYNVFKAFPPKRHPVYVMPHSGFHKKEETVLDIFYGEDEIRAKFYDVYGMGPRLLDLSKPNHISTCQRFVEKYTDLESQGTFDHTAIFEETAKVLLAERIVLRRRGAPVVSLESRDPVLELKLKAMLTEQQSGSFTGSQESVERNL